MAAMSPKQEIYREMLKLALPWIRNVDSNSPIHPGPI